MLKIIIENIKKDFIQIKSDFARASKEKGSVTLTDGFVRLFDKSKRKSFKMEVNELKDDFVRFGSLFSVLKKEIKETNEVRKKYKEKKKHLN